MTSDAPLLIDHRGAVDWLTLNRPASGNALNPALVDALAGYFEGLPDRPATRAVVLRANGRHFCAGLDLTDTAFNPPERGPGPLWDIQRRIARIYPAMRRCPQPIIALAQGAACGGGFSLLMASDIRIAGESARMNAAYLRIGLTGCDMGSSYFLPRLVGSSLASELLLTGRFLEAERALATGFVSAVVPDAELATAAASYLDDMLAATPMGLRLTKEALNHALDAPGLEAAMAMENRHQSLLALSEDAAEAAQAFVEKRAPQFHDR
ncbi:enoyl-CoA hydratase/isomerase family protein [Pseudohaliea rubra]|uniref:Enoyl-CoA hydratase n=1 Tax=Pseudohaliea rubra DSM 19751 TaxID=1265313 RepID=A0A095VPT1_9GAMM|nr:enoyl-CoA hydratase-related protein [Pseudohaliea rubra]KGE03088.1 Enoyl-CoA hydratase [Pseudohaliea rubra DSM 19751]